ncbi:hypothetical protein Lal_00015823 [Lupinus albus]|nr:hypothetical protein Lal_00015823 [Lupinus albus]
MGFNKLAMFHLVSMRVVHMLLTTFSFLGNQYFQTVSGYPIEVSSGVGEVHKLPYVMLYNTRLPLNHVKVAIDVAKDDDALLPIPLDEDILTMGGAISTFVAWPIDHVHVVPNKGHEHSKPNEEKELDGSTTSPPIIEHGLHIYGAHVGSKSTSNNIKWTHIKTPRQTNEKDCDYYVLYFMNEINISQM